MKGAVFGPQKRGVFLKLEGFSHPGRCMKLSSVSPVTIVSTRLGHLFCHSARWFMPFRHAYIFYRGAESTRQPMKTSETLRDYGLSNGEMMEVVMMAAFAHFISAWADGSGILIDPRKELA